VAEIDYNNTDGLQVLWYLLTTEPFFWFILSIGFVAMIISWLVDNYIDQDSSHYDDNRHI
jgi:hypothetical protein